MKKILGTSLAMLALCGFVMVGSSYACGDETKAEKTSTTSACASKTATATTASATTKSACEAKATTASATSSCCAKGTTATTASAKTVSAKGAACSVENKAACGTATTTTAQLTNGTMQDCAKTCDYAGKCQFRTISIKGMTCGGCEQSVTTALTATPGVLKVVSVNYKTGTAVVCVDPTKVEDKVITTAVSNTGFEAQIIPAVATTTTTGTEAKACGTATTTGAKDACCSKDGKKTAETKETASKETAKNPL